MRILYLPSLNLNVDYFRIENPANEIVKQGKQGVFVDYFGIDPRSNKSWEFVLHNSHEEDADNIKQSLLSAFEVFDIIVIQRLQDLRTLQYLIGLKNMNPNVKVFIDLDDSINSQSQSAIKDLPKKYNDISKDCLRYLDGAIVTTPYLKAEVEKYNSNVHIMPNFLRKEDWVFEKKEKSFDGIRLGYIGASGHDQDLELVWDEWIDMLNKNPQFKLVLRIGGYKPDFIKDHPQVEFKNLSVHISEYPQKLSDLNIDVFLAPLADLRFNRSKSELKILEALSMNTPIVCSDMVTFNSVKASKYRDKGVFYANKGDWSNQVVKAFNFMQFKERRLKNILNKLYNPETIVKELIEFFENNIKVENTTPIITGKYTFRL